MTEYERLKWMPVGLFCDPEAMAIHAEFLKRAFEEEIVPKYIIKLNDGKRDYYLEWSTIVDAPTTYGMSRDEFEEYYLDEYGKALWAGLAARLKAVELNGHSAFFAKSVDDLISFNRAGKDEKSLTKKQIIRKYCTHQPEGSS